MGQGSQGPCQDCLTVNGFLYISNNIILIEYKTEVDVIFGQNRTHFTEFYINGVLKATEGFENVGFDASKVYSYSLDLEPYEGEKVEVEVKEYKTNDNETNGELLRETSRVLFDQTLLNDYDAGLAISVLTELSPNSCRGQTFTAFSGIPTENQIKEVCRQSPKLYIAEKNEGAAFLITFADLFYDRATWSYRNLSGAGTELDAESTNSNFQTILPSTTVVVGFNSVDLSFNADYNNSYPIVVKFYKGGSVVQTIVIPLLVVGEKTDLTSNPKSTLSAPIPQMILHNPIGDGSESFMETSSKTCSQITTSMDGSQNTNAYLDVQVGVEGSVVGIPFEAYGSARTDVTTEQGNSQQVVSESCLSMIESIKIFNSEDDEITVEGTDGDLFIGMSTRYKYGPSIKISHTNCGVAVTNGIGIQVEKTFPFAKRQIDIEREIQTINQTLASNNGLSDQDLRYLENDRDAWQQMVDKNKAYVQNSQNELRVYDVQSGISQDFSLEVSRTGSFTMETKLFVENSVSGTAGVKVAGTGFEAGGGVKVSNTVSNGNTTSTDYSDVTGFSLLENDPGDIVKIRVKEDKRFGSFIYELVENGSQTSCPYIGGARRDLPALRVGPEETNYLKIEDAPIGDGENDLALVNLKICNNSGSNETRDYLLLAPETRSAIILYSGTPLTNSGVILRDIPSGTCEDVFVTIDQPEANVTSFKDIQFELTDLCEQYEAPSAQVSIDIEFTRATSTKDIPVALRTATLEQNIPNPTSAQTMIGFHIPPVAQRAQLQIVGIGGRVIRDLNITSKGAGQINLDTQNLQQGLYFYRLVIDGFQIDTKRMAILK
ncbi:MAG: hypothetical protein Sapg2KO_27860 [Saprospiraceae bacterium]